MSTHFRPNLVTNSGYRSLGKYDESSRWAVLGPGACVDALSCMCSSTRQADSVAVGFHPKDMHRPSEAKKSMGIKDLQQSSKRRPRISLKECLKGAKSSYADSSGKMGLLLDDFHNGSVTWISTEFFCSHLPSSDPSGIPSIQSFTEMISGTPYSHTRYACSLH